MDICGQIKAKIDENISQILSLRNEKTMKEDNSYVSKGDLLCEEIIKDFLSKNHPSIALISEESPEQNEESFEANEVFILDPIDGTENFVSGLKEWGVAMCYYKNGLHQQSMLYMPELFAYLKTGESSERFESRICGISSSLTKEDILKLEPGFEYRIIGCCVYNTYNVVKGSYHSFENPKGAYVWDIIPGLNLALEHGLSVTVNNEIYNGELLHPSKKYTFKISN